jgi:histidine triad (HIT) family protein
VLVVPRRHIAALDEAQDGDEDLLGRLLIASKRVAEQENLSNGYRVLTNTGPDSGQVVFHLHFHVIGGRKLGGMA